MADRSGSTTPPPPPLLLQSSRGGLRHHQVATHRATLADMAPISREDALAATAVDRRATASPPNPTATMSPTSPLSPRAIITQHRPTFEAQCLVAAAAVTTATATVVPKPDHSKQRCKKAGMRAQRAAAHRLHSSSDDSPPPTRRAAATSSGIASSTTPPPTTTVDSRSDDHEASVASSSDGEGALSDDYDDDDEGDEDSGSSGGTSDDDDDDAATMAALALRPPPPPPTLLRGSSDPAVLHATAGNVVVAAPPSSSTATPTKRHPWVSLESRVGTNEPTLKVLSLSRSGSIGARRPGAMASGLSDSSPSPTTTTTPTPVVAEGGGLAVVPNIGAQRAALRRSTSEVTQRRKSPSLEQHPHNVGTNRSLLRSSGEAVSREPTLQLPPPLPAIPSSQLPPVAEALAATAAALTSPRSAASSPSLLSSPPPSTTPPGAASVSSPSLLSQSLILEAPRVRSPSPPSTPALAATSNLSRSLSLSYEHEHQHQEGEAAHVVAAPQPRPPLSSAIDLPSTEATLMALAMSYSRSLSNLNSPFSSPLRGIAPNIPASPGMFAPPPAPPAMPPPPNFAAAHLKNLVGQERKPKRASTLENLRSPLDDSLESAPSDPMTQMSPRGSGSSAAAPAAPLPPLTSTTSSTSIKRKVGRVMGGLVRGRRQGNQQHSLGDKFDRSVPVVPRLVEQCVEHLLQVGMEVEGLFRVSGSRDHVASLRKCFERGKQPVLSDYHPHVVAETLKGFLRTLRENHEPLCTFELYHAFLEALDTGDNAAQKAANLRAVVHRLPPGNFVVLKKLSYLCHLLPTHQHKNKMTYASLGIVFAPNFLEPPELSNSKTEVGVRFSIASHAAAMAQSNQAIQSVFENYESIFAPDESSATLAVEPELHKLMKRATLKLARNLLLELENQDVEEDKEYRATTAIAIVNDHSSIGALQLSPRYSSSVLQSAVFPPKQHHHHHQPRPKIFSMYETPAPITPPPLPPNSSPAPPPPVAAIRPASGSLSDMRIKYHDEDGEHADGDSQATAAQLQQQQRLRALAFLRQQMESRANRRSALVRVIEDGDGDTPLQSVLTAPAPPPPHLPSPLAPPTFALAAPAPPAAKPPPLVPPLSLQPEQ